jgi:hypothetical protein
LKNKKALKSLPLLLIAALFVAPGILPVHAATGVVCLATTSSSSCPSTAATFGGSPGSSDTVNVMAQGSDAYNTFDISVKADNSIINPTMVSVNTGTFAVVAQVCINGTPVVGTSCSATDGVGIVHVVAGSFQPVSNTAVLFSITYSILGTTGASGTPIGYQTGCSPTSVSGTTTCVALINPTTGLPDSETVQAAVFNNAVQDFSLVASPVSVTVQQGFSATTSIVVTGLGGFTGMVSLTASISPTTGAPSLSLSPTTVSLAGGSGSSSLTVSSTLSTATGSFTATVTGTGTTNVGVVTHSIAVPVTVTVILAPHFIKGALHWTHHVKLNSTGFGVETWSADVQNTNGSAVFAQVVIGGVSETGAVPFTAMSAVTTMAAGQTLTIPTSSTFSMTNKFSFTAIVIYGFSLDASGNIVDPITSPISVSGTFAVAK